MNVVSAYLTANRERLGLDALGVPAEPTCLVLTPRFCLSRHIVGLVLDETDGRPLLVAKLPRLAGDGAALAREATALRAVAHALGSTAAAATYPSLLVFADREPHPLLLETALHGAALSPAAVRRDRPAAVAAVAAWLVALANATAAPARDAAWFERLVEAPLRELARSGGRGSEVGTMVEQTLDLARPLRAAAPQLVMVHGDLGHPNILRQVDGRLGVMDWERGEPAGLPAEDLLFFLAYAAMASSQADRDGGRLSGVRAAFEDDGWAWPVARAHAERTGLDPALLGLLLAVTSARAVAVAGAGGALTRAASARDAAARHMLLWRMALDRAGISSRNAIAVGPR